MDAVNPLTCIVIQISGDATTEDLFNGIGNARTRNLAGPVKQHGPRKLDMLDAAVALDDLKAPPGNQLEALKGKLAGFHSMRINKQWRIIFRWVEGGPAARMRRRESGRARAPGTART